jgi:Peptidase family C25
MSNPFVGISSPRRLLIITPEPFLAAVQPLVEYKNFTGMSAVAVTIANLKSFFGASLSGQPKATDDAEVIKLAIQYAHENLRTEYVLLVGDSQNFPVRYWFANEWGNPLYPGTTNPIPSNPSGGFVQSDLYYANLYHHDGTYPNLVPNGFDSWDTGSPGLYNQSYGGNPAPPKGKPPTASLTSLNPNKVDGYPDIALGRIPAANADEATAYIKKVIAYEAFSLGVVKPTISFVADKQYGSFDLTLNLAHSLQSANLPAINANYLMIENYPNAVSLASFNDQLFAAFIAEDGGGDLHIASLSDAEAAHWTNLPNVGQKSVTGPALISFDPLSGHSALWMAFVQYNIWGSGPIQLRYSVDDGKSWSSPINAGPPTLTATSKETPALATMLNSLYLAYVVDDDSDQIFVISSADGKSWGQPFPVPGQNSCAAPALAAFTPAGSNTSLLWMAFVTNDATNKVFICSSPDGQTRWSQIIQIGTQNNTAQSTTSPALAAFDGKLYAAYVAGDGSYDLVVSSSVDGVTWPKPVQIPGQKSKAAPTFTVFGDRLYIGFRGHNSATLHMWSLAAGANQSWTASTAPPDASALCPGPFVSTAHTDLASAVGESFYVSYIGHGGPSGFGHIELFSNQDLLNNKNWPVQPIVFAAACQTTLFAGNVPWDLYPFTDVNGNARSNFYANPNAKPGAPGPVVFEGNPPEQIWGVGAGFAHTAPASTLSGDHALPVNIPLPNVYNSDPLDCIGKVWTIGCAPGGAIAYFGLHDVATPGPDVEMEGYILKNYLQSPATDTPPPGDHSLSGYPVLGDIYLQAQRSYWEANQSLASTPAQGDYHGIPRIYLGWLVLFGDPSLRLPPVAAAKPAPGARLAQRVGDMDGDGLDEILVTGPWGIAILKQSHHKMVSLASIANGVHIGGWKLETATDNFRLVANFDNSDRASILVTSGRGIAILKFDSGKLVELTSARNGHHLGHGPNRWKLDSASDVFGPVADFDGDGQSEVLITSPTHLGVLKYSNGSFTTITRVADGTNMGGWTLNTGVDRFVATADFDQGGQDQVFVTSPSGVTFLTLASTATATSSGLTPNGRDLGGWKLETSNNVFGQAGNYITFPAAFPIRPQLFVSSPSGIAILADLSVLAFFPNGQLPGGWDLKAGSSVFGPTADYDGDSHDEILVTSSSGLGVLSFRNNVNAEDGTSSFEAVCETVVPNGNSVGTWSLDTRTNNLGTAANYSPSYGQPILGQSQSVGGALQGPVQKGVFVTSGWGIGILKFPELQGLSSPMMLENGASFVHLLQPDGTHSGHWNLDTARDQF